ncbi:hypothetical protein D5085_06155 [Ectothiorhodospiraceae bacterium BW-2]|nr:hypothetical protein D5085_06155 [Ectothiorhodospiraceae bacterium BW-2]
MKVTSLILLLALLGGCATAPPKHIDNACEIFREKSGWYSDASDVSERYGVPIQIQLAFVRQESAFLHDARPERERLLGFIPWFRPSSAYGYAQIKDETWEWYRDKTGRYGDDRDDFGDAVNFIGWYVDLSHKTLGISKWDAYKQYLAYHEGHTGYKRKSYLKKPWLIKVARKVKSSAGRYGAQLKQCAGEFDRGPWWWPF